MLTDNGLLFFNWAFPLGSGFLVNACGNRINFSAISQDDRINRIGVTGAAGYMLKCLLRQVLYPIDALVNNIFIYIYKANESNV